MFIQFETDRGGTEVVNSDRVVRVWNNLPNHWGADGPCCALGLDDGNIVLVKGTIAQVVDKLNSGGQK